MNAFLSAARDRNAILVVALVIVILSSVMVQPVTSTAYASSNSNDDIPIPYAEVSQSSYYAPFGAFEDLFSQESEKHPNFPWYTHFSRDLVTDEKGHASTETMFGRVYISSAANGFLQRSTELPLREGEIGNVTLTLKRTGAIVGTVYDDSGNPLPGVVVDVSGIAIYDEQGQAERCEIYANDISGYDGTYIITSGIDPNCGYRIQASVPSYAYYSQWYLNPFLRQQLGEDSADDPSGRTVLKFKDPYRQDDRYQSLLFNSTTIDRVKVEQDKVTVVNIVLHSMPAGKERSGSISGRVIDVNGNPISDAIVRASASDEDAESTTDRNGFFLIKKLKAGNYTVDVQPLDRRLVVRHVTNVIVEEDLSVNVGDIIGQRSASIRGKVTLSDGAPLPGLFVEIKPIKLEKGYENYYPCENCIVTYISDELDRRGTDKQGNYFLAKNLPPGTYSISVNNYELQLGDRTIQLEPITVTVDVHGEGKDIADADLVFNYTVVQDFADLKDTTIRFFGFVRDVEGNPLSGIGITARTFIHGYGSIDRQTLTNESGFYSMYISQTDVPNNEDGMKWTLYVDPTPNYGPSYNLYYEDVVRKDFAIYNYTEGKGQRDVIANWGDQKRLDYTLQRFTMEDILRSNIEVDVIGEVAKYNLPTKQFVLTTGYGDGDSGDLYLTTNSTLVGAWLDTTNDTIAVEINPIAGTAGNLDIAIPKKVATGISTVLFDGREDTDDDLHARSVRISENATHTTVSLTYGEDFKRIELQAARVVPEFGTTTITIFVIATSIAGGVIVVGARMKIRRKHLG